MRSLLRKLSLCLALVLLLAASALAAPNSFPSDVLPAKGGDVTITFIGHGSLMFQWQGKVVYVDPWTRLDSYEDLPKADLVLVTHEHDDHLDPRAVKRVTKPGTLVAASRKAARKLDDAKALENGQSADFGGIKVDAVPAYNVVNKRYHAEGDGNGYVIHFGELRVYVAGDTEDVPEMAALKGVDVAFLPCDGTYTMTLGMLTKAVAMVQPKILYPYHTNSADMAKVEEALKGVPGMELRIRPMK